ncbi:hypothetical protein [Lactococcus taiwanensis]|uniref:hypothetical protein n=1 Tax=Lactococcus taiwanensis TaxID=1151742 RepID=UPI0023F36F07|nr:hypothetical protein [Lactococcus taiwanensis]
MAFGQLLLLPVFHLDNVVHDGERKRSEQEVSGLIQQILQDENFIIEDTFRDRFTSLLTV